MKTNEIRNALYPNCPIRNVLSRVGDKWSMLILFTLENHPTIRFKELQRNIPDISQKMLNVEGIRGRWVDKSRGFPRSSTSGGVCIDGEREVASATY